MYAIVFFAVSFVWFSLMLDSSCFQGVLTTKVHGDLFILSDQCRTLKFSPTKAFIGRRLINHVLRVSDVIIDDFCMTLCYMEPNCVSFNLKLAASDNGNHKCELNNSTHEGYENDLSQNPNYKYHGAESNCVKNPCKNGGTCQTGFTERGYHCLCTAEFSGSSCEKDYYALSFQTKGTSDYVIKEGMPELTAVTVCLWMKTTDVLNMGTPLSYNVPGNNVNELTLYNYNKFQLFIGDSDRVTGVSANDGQWHHICAAWENTAGSWKLYKDGEVEADGTGFKTGHVIRSGGILILGQEQDSMGGSFEASQSFVGEMTGVNIWDQAIKEPQIKTMSKPCLSGVGNVFQWRDFKLHLKGSVKIIEPSCQPT